jgi:FMN-dependent NADH-azoreductase
VPTLLHISASPRAAASHSRRAGEALRHALEAALPALRVTRRDLASPPLPHVDGGFAEASLMPAAERGPPQVAALALSEALIGELEAADLVLVDTPMHNFTVPSTLKAWIDHVVRPGRSFALTPAGKVGMLRDRPVFVAVACGGGFDGPAAQQDFLAPYLRYVLGTIGIAQVEVLRLDRLNRGGAHRARIRDTARAWLADRIAAGAVPAARR